ncbi:sarcolemmal membrane-associated protein isoform X1 [Nematostella vectensis]|uniref:sarcolemmal membrane-associated protein isoform X1 n=1 Tax=Nematostella vectensis TaxID=45351 RepID=UPI00139000BB|nr:sarcolemmal membrane-associated protein isoform X1 [Nematostella vectensis]
MAMAILTARPNSHIFEERKVLLTETAKVGRSVAKNRPAPNNCIFDCKVLSRNHAILWFQDGKFFLQDTKSSNGTYVNNVRLSKGSEESEPRELRSGDIVQFGVDVVENSKKVTHGCIIANVTLFLPDGQEAIRSSSTKGSSVSEGGLQVQELWQLSQYLQDALYREEMLETKLAALQRLIGNSQIILDENAQKFAQEDKLLSRLETLESQVEALTRNLSEEDIKRQLLNLQEDRHTYEMRAKESLKRILQEKLEAVQKLAEAERTCSNTEDECLHFKSLYERSQEEMRDLSNRHSERLKEMKTLQQQVEEAESRHAAADEKNWDEIIAFYISNASQERSDIESRLEDARCQEAMLAARAESLQAECDFTKQQLSAMKAHLAKTREHATNPAKSQSDTTMLNNTDGDEVREVSSDISAVRVPHLASEPLLSPCNTIDQVPSNPAPIASQPELFHANGEIEDRPEVDFSSTDDVKLLQANLVKLEDDVVHKERLLSSLEVKLQQTRNSLVESQEEVCSLKDILSSTEHQLQEDKTKIRELEEQVMEYYLKSIDQLAGDDSATEEVDGEESVKPRTQSFHDRFQELFDKIFHVKALVKERRNLLLQWAESDEDRQHVVAELMANSESQSHDETILEREGSKEAEVFMSNGLKNLKDIEDYVADIEKLIDSEHEGGLQLKEELRNAQAYTKEFKQQVLDLRDKILEEQEQSRKKEEYAANLKRQVGELTHERDLLKVERTGDLHSVVSAQSSAREMQRQAAKSAEEAGKYKVELSALGEDNTTLRQRIQTLESELKRYRRENNRLSVDHTNLQMSLKKLEDENREEHDRHVKQKLSLEGKVEHEAKARRDSTDKAIELEDRLWLAEKALKEKEEESTRTITQAQQSITQLRNMLVSVLIAVLAMTLAYALGLISISAGGKKSASNSPS